MSNKYIFPTIAKVKTILTGIIVLGITGTILFFIGKIDHLKYFTWIPFVWIAYLLFCAGIGTFTTSFRIDDDIGLILTAYPDIEVIIPWEKIEKIKISKRGEKIISLIIFHKNLTDNTNKIFKGPISLDADIQNHEKLFETILTNVKKKNDNWKQIFVTDKSVGFRLK